MSLQSKEMIAVLCALFIGLEYILAGLYFNAICCQESQVMKLFKSSLNTSIPLYVICLIIIIITGMRKPHKLTLKKPQISLGKYDQIIADLVKTKWFELVLIFTFVVNPFFTILMFLMDLYLTKPHTQSRIGMIVPLIVGEVIVLLTITWILFPKMRKIRLTQSE